MQPEQQTREALRTQEQSQQAREQAQQAREQAQQIREQARQIREEALRAAREAARQAGQDIRVQFPPGAPMPPGQEEIVVHPRGPWDGRPHMPPEAVDISMTFIVAMAAVLILRPLMRAFGNRLERRGAPTALPPEVTAHMERLEQAIEAVAIEVERISEGQRYTAKLLAERAGKQS